jgi:hypothetical protein
MPIDVDGAGLVTALVDPVYAKDAANLGTGSVLYTSKDGSGNIQLRSVIGGSGVDLTQNANDITIDVNDTYINNLIDTRVAGGAGAGDAPTYLFSAASNSDFGMTHGDTINPFAFPNDADSGHYDYSNTWLTTEWVAPTGVASNVDFNLMGTVEVIDAPAGASTLTFSLDKNGSSSSIATATLTGLAAGEQASFSGVKAETGIIAGDVFKINVTMTATAGESATIKAGAVFNNSEA